MATIKLFFIQDDGTRQEGGIYEVEASEKAELLADGKAVLLDLPTLEALKTKVVNTVDSAQASITALKQSERYDDHEAERYYLIAEAEQQLKADIAAIKEECETEKAVLYGQITPELFNVNYGTDEEREKAA